MDIAENKAPELQIRGVPVSAYKTPELINLAQSLCEMNADVDPNFRDYSIDHVLKNRLTLLGGMIISDLFKMEHLSNDFSNLPNFGLKGIGSKFFYCFM